MARAGGQSERENEFGHRCGRPAEHGDHFYSWSKGDSTSFQNFVAARARCNRAKRAKIHRRASNNVWNDDGGTMFRRRPPSVPVIGSRSLACGWFLPYGCSSTFTAVSLLTRVPAGVREAIVVRSGLGGYSSCS